MAAVLRTMVGLQDLSGGVQQVAVRISAEIDPLIQNIYGLGDTVRGLPSAWPTHRLGWPVCAG